MIVIIPRPQKEKAGIPVEVRQINTSYDVQNDCNGNRVVINGIRVPEEFRPERYINKK